MNNKNNQGEYIKSHILDVSEKFENRLPCSSEEKNAAYAFSDQIKNETEVLPIVETFKTNPLSYIGILWKLCYTDFISYVMGEFRTYMEFLR